MLLRLVLFFLIIITPVFAENGDGLPEALIADSTYNFGDVVEGTVVKHSFEIENKGRGDLVIQNIIPSCGCTAAASNFKSLAAGEKGAIDVSFDTTGFSGQKIKTVQILLNDLQKSSAVLKLTGEIISDIQIQPTRIFYGNISKSEIANIGAKEVKISIAPDSSAEIIKILNPSKHITILSEIGNRKEKRIHVQLTNDVKEGQLRERLIVKLKNAKRASFNIPVFANITKDLVLDPPVLSFGLIQGPQPLERTVKIINYSNTPVRVFSAKSENSALRVNLRNVSEGRNYLLDIVLDPDKILESSLNTSVEMLTDSASVRNLMLNVFAVLPPKTK